MPDLPIESVLPALLDTLSREHDVVLEAPPGAGKTTRVPLALLGQPWLETRRIVMLEPRRLAARSVSEYMAGLIGEPVGHTVGYRTRLDTKISDTTQIEVVTDGILIRMLEQDPSLAEVGAVIFDEFHERNIDSDLGLAMVLYGRALLRESTPLKLIVMSATLDGLAVADYLGDAPVIRSEGRAFKVDTVYGETPRMGDAIEIPVVKAIAHALSHHEGSVLVFLPGQAEIRRVQGQLKARLDESTMKHVDVLPLYGQLDFEQQRLAIAPPVAGKRKVVLATAIAETSLTLEGITVVVDSGLSRVPRFDPRTAMTRLQTERVSHAASRQRAGRAGRTQAGVCYRLWSEETDRRLVPFAAPEILEADLTPLVMSLFRFGVSDADELAWLDAPPKGALGQALELLVSLDAITAKEASARLTRRGELMASLPLHPRLGAMIIKAQTLGLTDLACDVCAVLSTRDLVRSAGADLTIQVSTLRDGRNRDKNVLTGALGEARRLRRRFADLAKRLGVSPATTNRKTSDLADLGCLIALAYPDRIGCLSNKTENSYLLANGRTARLRSDDALAGTPWLAVSEIGGGSASRDEMIFGAAALDVNWFDDELKDIPKIRDIVAWPQSNTQLIAERQRTVGKIILSRAPLKEPPREQKLDAVIEFVRKKGIGVLPWTQESRLLQQRVQFVKEGSGETSDATRWPDLSDAGLAASLDDWLAPFLGAVRHIDHIGKLDLKAMFEAMLPWDLKVELDQLAPARYRVPSGTTVAIDYSERPPVLAVRLQALFGLDETPSIGGGVALKIHLLSPARRPIQVTQDLAGFWRGSYQEVRKEMKGRYPKHNWPEDPLAATPTNRTKRSRS